MRTLSMDIHRMSRRGRWKPKLGEIASPELGPNWTELMLGYLYPGHWVADLTERVGWRF